MFNVDFEYDWEPDVRTGYYARFEVQAAVEAGCNASYRGHPDTWFPAEPSTVDVRSVTLLEITEALVNEESVAIPAITPELKAELESQFHTAISQDERTREHIENAAYTEAGRYLPSCEHYA